MSWVAVGVGVASIGLGLYSGNEAKKASKKEAEYQRLAAEKRRIAANLEADVLEQQAGNSIAVAQRDKMDIERQGRLVQSRAIALAAASGGGASSAPGFVKLYGDLAKESSYNAARALYAGMEKARLQRLQAKELREMGEFAVVGGNISAEIADARGRAAELKAAGTALETGTSLYTKYGGKGPNDTGGKATPLNEFSYTGGTPTDPAYG